MQGKKKNDTIKPKSISMILAAQDTSLSSKKEASRWRENCAKMGLSKFY